MAEGKIYCITGIDTDIGKTYVTGLLGKFLLQQRKSVITQKISQTGCVDFPEDIAMHREIMGVELFPEDRDGLTCPYIFPVPCSPHLAARLAGDEIDPVKIRQAVLALRGRYEYVLLEGVGGLMVPLTEELLLADFLTTLPCRVILVSSPRLGSINHTLAALELMHARELDVAGIIYNCYQRAADAAAIAAAVAMPDDSRQIFLRYLERFNMPRVVIDAEDVTAHPVPDFSPLFCE